MKTIALIPVALAFSLSAAAQQYGCHPAPNGVMICVDPPVCADSLVFVPELQRCLPKCEGAQVRDTATGYCRMPAAAMACEVRIMYSQGNPEDAVVINEMGPWCDRAALKRALAAELLDLLSQP